MLDCTKVKVELGERSYDINIGQGIISNLAEELVNMTSSKQIILISNDIVYNIFGYELKESLEKQGFQVLINVIPDGEKYKTWQMAEEILDIIIKAKYNRDATMIALGGGVVGDLAGFIAAIYQRGINLIQIPTTLLAQVDSSVGGKVAVNHPLGKNMIGTFHQPLGVWADLDTIKTLPEREWFAGLAEVVKYGVIWDEDFFIFLEKNIHEIKSRNLEIIKEIITRSCTIKAEVVAKDERDQNIRAILNFGHTIGHAVESVTEYNVYRHGEAVAIGMIAAVNLAINLKMCSTSVKDRLQRLLTQLNLPISLPNVSLNDILSHLQLDKKIKENELVFILPKKIGQVEIIKGLSLDQIGLALKNDA